MNLPPPEAVYKAIDESNLIGRGGNAGVYRLEGYPEVVIRALNHFSSEKNVPFAETKIVDDSAYKGRNYGQAIAEYGEGVTLLLRQNGIPCGVPTYLRRDKLAQASNDALYEKQTALAASMPQESYTNLLRDMQFIHSIDRRVDPSKANNLLMDTDSNRFNLVDLNRGDSRSDYKNSPAEFVPMLFDNSYGWQYKGQNAEGLTQNRKVILEKIISAAEELQIPFCHSSAKADSSFAYSLTLAGYAEGSPERAAIEARIDATGIPRRADGQSWVAGAPPKGSGFSGRLE